MRDANTPKRRFVVALNEIFDTTRARARAFLARFAWQKERRVSERASARDKERETHTHTHTERKSFLRPSDCRMPENPRSKRREKEERLCVSACFTSATNTSLLPFFSFFFFFLTMQWEKIRPIRATMKENGNRCSDYCRFEKQTKDQVPRIGLIYVWSWCSDLDEMSFCSLPL